MIIVGIFLNISELSFDTYVSADIIQLKSIVVEVSYASNV